MLIGLKAALDQFRAVNCPRVCIDGSFVPAKEEPGDFDGCWDFDAAMDWRRLDPVLLDTSFPRTAQKARYGGEFFPSRAVADNEGRTFREFFQIDKRTEDPKRIVVIPLR